MNRIVAIAIAALHALVAATASAQAPDYERQRTAAAELARMCEADGGRLWRVSLCGPFIWVDPQTRAAWANQDAPGGVLRPGGGGWIGVLPADVPMANTAIEWAGVRWTMVMSLPDDATDQRVLLAHEAWHRIQPELGLATQSTDNAHLEDERGRYLLRLELRALRAAMQGQGEARWTSAREALLFRTERLRHYPAAAAEEAALDRNEGIASYTGVKLGAAEEAHAYAARTLERYDASAAYSRSYAYASGPAYGLLLDERVPAWRLTLGRSAPADMLASALGVEANARALSQAASRHDPAGRVAAAEAERGNAHRALLAEVRARYGARSRRLVLPIDGPITFDPQRVTPVAGMGKLFGMFTARGPWGSLQAQDGALVAPTASQVIVAEPGADGLSGPGWTVTLAPGYRICGPDDDGVMSVLEPPARRPE
jgi:hypothetical protein